MMPFHDIPQYLDFAVRPLADLDYSASATAPAAGSSSFRASVTQTYRDLRRELDAIDAKERTLYVPIEPGNWRRDGLPRSDSRLTSSTIALQFVAGGKTQQYIGSRYLTWQENLRAIAKTLEALRAVDRYGLTDRGQQYQGFAAIEAPKARAQDARKDLRRIAGLAATTDIIADNELIRRARIAAHPDRNDGSRVLWDRVEAAIETLKGEA